MLWESRIVLAVARGCYGLSAVSPDRLVARRARNGLEELVGKVDPRTTTNAGSILLRGLGVRLFLLDLD